MAFARAHSRLWKVIQQNDSQFPGTAITCGIIAEHYTRIFLANTTPDAIVRFGGPSQKGWDIEVLAIDGTCTRYQVKAISSSRKSRTISSVTRGFDRLLVLYLDELLFPMSVYLFEDPDEVFGSRRTCSLTVPDATNPRRRGSAAFIYSKDITKAFWASLE